MFALKQGDTAPSATADLNADLTGATVRFRMRKADSGTSVIDALATVTDAAQGLVKYDWVAGNTNTVGNYECEFVVTYGGGAVQRFPARGYLEVVILDAIEVPV